MNTILAQAKLAWRKVGFMVIVLGVVVAVSVLIGSGNIGDVAAPHRGR